MKIKAVIQKQCKRFVKKLDIFKRKAEWLLHPDSPGMRVLVVRGFWGRLFKPTEFATLNESIDEGLRDMKRRDIKSL